MNILKTRQQNEALKLIISTPTIHVEPSVYMTLLQICIENKAQNQAHSVHTHIITNGYHSSVNLSNKLVIFYGKVGDILSARKVFDRMRDRNVVSWTAMISGYARGGFYEDALLVFKGMYRDGVRANQFTFGSALRACIRMGRLWSGMQIQGCIEKGRLGENLFVKSALLDLHAKCGRVEDAWLLFETMKERDVVSWNSMIGGFALQGFVDDSLRLFQLMMKEGHVPDCFTLGSILRTSIGGIGLMNVHQIHGLIIKLSFGSSNTLIGSLIDAYAKCGNIRTAYRLYENLVKKDIVSCTALISGFARNKNFSGEAFDLFKEMIVKKMEIDDVMLCLLLNMCANMASLSLGKQVHAFALKCQPSYDVAMGNALIDMYAKSGEIKDARLAFNEMGEKNVISWTSLIAGYGKHGYGHKAIALYEQMEYEGMKPNDITFLALLFACTHTGLNREGWELFNNMVRKHKIMPRDEHFSCVVDLFARGGHLESAYDIICKMNIKPSASIWSAILGACSIYGSKSLGELAAMNLFNMEPERSVNYVVLSSIYAAAGEWDNAWNIRKLMEERCLRKNPGSSFI